MATNEPLSALTQTRVYDDDDMIYIVDKSENKSKRIDTADLLRRNSETTNINLLVSKKHQTVYVNSLGMASSIDITIPSSIIAQEGSTVIIKDIGGDLELFNKMITIETEGSEPINGSSNITISKKYGSVFLVSNGTGLYTIGNDHKVEDNIDDIATFTGTPTDVNLNTIGSKINEIIHALENQGILELT